MKYSGLMSGIYAVSEWIMRFSVINILWVVFNLPIVFILMSMFLANQLADIFYLLPILLVLIPILFFPATQAMFASVRNWVIKRDEDKLTKSFWRYYKENYRKSFLGGTVLTMIWIVWGADVYYFSTINIIVMFFFGVLGLLLYVYTINFFSVSAHYDMKLRKIFKNTFLITLGSPILFFAVLITSGFLILISVTKFQFLIPFFMGTMIAFFAFASFYRLYLKLANTE